MPELMRQGQVLETMLPQRRRGIPAGAMTEVPHLHGGRGGAAVGAEVATAVTLGTCGAEEEMKMTATAAGIAVVRGVGQGRGQGRIREGSGRHIIS